MHRFLTGTLATLACIGGAHATTAWDESVSGDFSNTGLSPTVVTLTEGANLVRGVTGRSGGVVDRDYFRFTIADGWQLDTLNVLPGTRFVNESDFAFIGVQAGNQVTVNPTGGSATGLLGWVHYSVNDIGTDILGLMGIGFGAAGFTTPLPAGAYSFWIQNTATGSSPYVMEFNVSAVPEASALSLFAAGLAGLSVLGARRRLSC